jgi:hypothetical protein
MDKFRGLSYAILGILILAIGVTIIILLTKRTSSPLQTTSGNSCKSQQLSIGSMGNCVSDLQTMVNFMETDGLNQCPFTGSAALVADGSYDESTEEQVKVVQTWFDCYATQEGLPPTIAVNGTATSATWSELCIYAYSYPSKSGTSPSSYLKSSIAAGKNAGC